METNRIPSADTQCFTHREYAITVTAQSNEADNWYARIHVTRHGQPVALDLPEEVAPFWETREEALRAGVERAVALLDRRDRA